MRRCQPGRTGIEVSAVGGADIAEVALQFSVGTGGFASTVVGPADASEVRRNVRWLDEPVDEELLHEVERCLAPARNLGWVNGRPENQRPRTRG
jgi:L-galactose dehydrogenase